MRNAAHVPEGYFFSLYELIIPASMIAILHLALFVLHLELEGHAQSLMASAEEQSLQKKW